MSNYIFSCIRLHLIKVCFCYFLDIHLFSNNLSTIAKISSLNTLQLFLACFSRSKNFNLSRTSLGSDDKSFVESSEAMIAGDLSNFISVRFQVDLLPGPFTLKCIPSAKSYNSFLSGKLARSTL